jgi:hypothetical protein
VMLRGQRKELIDRRRGGGHVSCSTTQLRAPIDYADR